MLESGLEVFMHKKRFLFLILSFSICVFFGFSQKTSASTLNNLDVLRGQYLTPNDEWFDMFNEQYYSELYSVLGDTTYSIHTKNEDDIVSLHDYGSTNFLLCDCGKDYYTHITIFLSDPDTAELELSLYNNDCGCSEYYYIGPSDYNGIFTDGEYYLALHDRDTLFLYDDSDDSIITDSNIISKVYELLTSMLYYSRNEFLMFKNNNNYVIDTLNANAFFSTDVFNKIKLTFGNSSACKEQLVFKSFSGGKFLYNNNEYNSFTIDFNYNNSAVSYDMYIGDIKLSVGKHIIKIIDNNEFVCSTKYGTCVPFSLNWELQSFITLSNEKYYTAYFDSRGGEEVPTLTFTATDKIFPHNAISTNVENPIILPSTTKEGFKFLGWSYSEEPNCYEYSTMDFISLTVDYDLYFYANWEDLRLNGDYKSNGYFILGKDGEEYLQSFSANVEFKSRNRLFSIMRFTFDDNGRYLYYDDLLVAYSNSESSGNVIWTSESYSNISFDNVYCDNNDFNLFIKYNFSLGSDDFASFSGYYCFDENVNYSKTLLIYSSFVSNGNVYRKIFVDNGTIYYDKTAVYDNVNGWTDEKYRLVNFSDTSILLENYALMLKYGDFGYVSFNSTNNNVTDLLFSFADIPVRIMSQLLDISIFGTTLFIAFCSILTVLICITVIKKFW